MAVRDFTLAIEAVSGNDEAFEKLYRQNYKVVFYQVKRYIKDDFLAEDLTQETFLKAYRFLKTYKGKASFASWLKKVATNICIDHLRKKNVPMASWPVYLSEDGEGVVKEFADESVDVLESVESKDNFDKIMDLVWELPHYYRDVVFLCDVMDMSGEKTAEKIECPSGTVKSRLFRAHDILRNGVNSLM